MALTFLCAGCSQGERDEAEATVKGALGERLQREPWAVSLVRVGATWSVTIDGPSLRALSFVCPIPRLAETILARLAPAPAAPPAAAQTRARPGVVRDRQECNKCRRAFIVVYEIEADEAQETAAVACPYCWQMNQVLVSESAAYTEAFKAERVES
jgi:hypothetical protein